MTKPPRKTCACCGAPIVEYRHSLSKLLVKTLQIAWMQSRHEPKPFKVSNNPSFTYSEASNFQKLRYWGFVQSVEHEGHVEGWWMLTPAAGAFLAGDAKAPKQIWTYRGELADGHIDDQVEMLTISQIDPDWEVPRRFDYARTSHLPKDDRQGLLL